MPHSDYTRWKTRPGLFDTGNRFFRPELTDAGYPIIRNQEVEIPTRLISYTQWKKYQPGDAIHFFVDDYRFEPLWSSPSRYLNRFTGKTVCSPDFSVYTDDPRPLQQWNVYRSRWLGAYLQDNGCTVIPTVTWSDRESFEFCFDGIEPGSVVAISTVGCRNVKHLFSAGVDAMIKTISPHAILCYGSFDKTYTGSKDVPNLINYAYEFGKFYGVIDRSESKPINSNSDDIAV